MGGGGGKRGKQVFWCFGLAAVEPRWVLLWSCAMAAFFLAAQTALLDSSPGRATDITGSPETSSTEGDLHVATPQAPAVVVPATRTQSPRVGP